MRSARAGAPGRDIASPVRPGRLPGWDYLRRRSIPDRITALGLPLLVIFGADDRRWRSASAAAYREVPGARVELLPGVGHTPIVEAPQPTASLLLDFAAAHAPF